MRFLDQITDFIFVEQKPQPADIIFVPGGNYPDAARHAASLYQGGWAPYVMPSGRYSIVKGRFELPSDEKGGTMPGRGVPNAEQDLDAKSVQKENVYETEWEYLSDILLQNGVPSHAILKEDQATYTYENAIYSRKKTDELGMTVKRAILCCQAFHARRSLLYYQEQFPETEFLVCPVVTKGISKENWFQSEQGIDTVLGEVERCGAQFHEIMRKYLKNEG